MQFWKHDAVQYKFGVNTENTIVLKDFNARVFPNVVPVAFLTPQEGSDAHLPRVQETPVNPSDIQTFLAQQKIQIFHSEMMPL